LWIYLFFDTLYEQGFITQIDRFQCNWHRAKFIVFAGEEFDRVASLAKELERFLFNSNYQTYYLGFNNLLLLSKFDL